MANLNAHYVGKRRNPHMARPADAKWSGRRTIGVALVASAALWGMIFWLAKALLV